MIAAAAVKVQIKATKEELIIPCHRHSNGFYILKLFGFRPGDYKILDQGFLNEKGEFLNRQDAYWEAVRCHQYNGRRSMIGELFSEDLW